MATQFRLFINRMLSSLQTISSGLSYEQECCIKANAYDLCNVFGWPVTADDQVRLLSLGILLESSCFDFEENLFDDRTQTITECILAAYNIGRAREKGHLNIQEEKDGKKEEEESNLIPDVEIGIGRAKDISYRVQYGDYNRYLPPVEFVCLVGAGFDDN